MYAQYLRFLPVAGLRFTLYALRFLPIAVLGTVPRTECTGLATHPVNNKNKSTAAEYSATRAVKNR